MKLCNLCFHNVHVYIYFCLLYLLIISCYFQAMDHFGLKSSNAVHVIKVILDKVV